MTSELKLKSPKNEILWRLKQCMVPEAVGANELSCTNNK